MKVSASGSLESFAHSARSAGVKKYASGDFGQSLYFVTSAVATTERASAAKKIKPFFTVPPGSRGRILSRGGISNRVIGGKVGIEKRKNRARDRQSLRFRDRSPDRRSPDQITRSPDRKSPD